MTHSQTQGAEGAGSYVDWDNLNRLFAQMPSGPWDASRDTAGHEIRQIDTDPTNKHHWPFRLCRSIPGQRAACDDAVFDFLAGVLNAWPQISAERSEEAEIERILAMPEGELRKRFLAKGESPEQSATIGRLCFDVASLRVALTRIGEQYVTHRGDMTDAEALRAIKSIADAALAAKASTPAPAATPDVRSLLRTARSGLATYGAGAFEVTIAQIDAILAYDPIFPAQAATPGVPDSVRALSEAASPDWDTNEATPYILGPPIDGEIDRFEVIARGPHGHAKSGDAIRKWQANRMFAVAAVNFVRTLIAAQPAGQAGDAGADARTVMTEACKPWEHYTGEPPDDGSPLSGVFVAGMVYTERLLAKLLDVTHYEGGDGSEDFDNDATQTLRNILTGAGLWDADENRAVKPAPDSTRTGAAETEDAPGLLDQVSPEQAEAFERTARNLTNLYAPDGPPALRQGILAALLRAHLAARPEAPSDAGWVLDLTPEQKPTQGFPNRAGQTGTDDAIAAELEAAGIEVFRSEAMRRASGEVKTAVRGELHGWGFTRAWRYWIAEGPGIELAAAEALYAAHPGTVRVNGHCGCPPPREQEKGLAIGFYHVDSPAGLKGLADTIKALVNRITPPSDPAPSGQAEG